LRLWNYGEIGRKLFIGTIPNRAYEGSYNENWGEETASRYVLTLNGTEVDVLLDLGAQIGRVRVEGSQPATYGVKARPHGSRLPWYSNRG
jgi:hypothetical protein